MKQRAAPPAAQNLVDKALAYFAPRVAQRRQQARLQLAITGGYTGARIDRAQLAAWRVAAGSPHSDVIVDLPMLRARSADLERNAPIATSVVGTSVQYVVGTGLACIPQIDGDFLGMSAAAATAWQIDTRRRFRAFAESTDCDIARTLNLYGLQDQALRGVLARGDIFAVTPRVDRDGTKMLALQMIEADLCCNPDRQADRDGLTEGVEYSTSTGEPIAYHFANRHPGDLRTAKSVTWSRVAARGGSTGRRNVLHLFKQVRPGLRRGIPILAPVIEPLKQLSRYTDAELQAAVTSGLFSLYMKMDPDAFADMFDDDARKTYLEKSAKWSGEMEAGQVVNLLPGEEPVAVNPGRPNPQFDPFVTACIRQVAVAVGIPFEVLVMHYQSSYTAARGALLMAWKFFMGWRDWLATNFCQPVYELWLADEVASGRIAAPGFFADRITRAAWCGSQWVGDGPGSIDPDKEVKAAAGRVALGISTLEAESLLHDGVDWDTKRRQREKENEQLREAGLAVPGAEPPKPEPARDGAAGDGAAALLSKATASLEARTDASAHELARLVDAVRDSRAASAASFQQVALLMEAVQRRQDEFEAALQRTLHGLQAPPAPRAIAREVKYDEAGNMTGFIDRELND